MEKKGTTAIVLAAGKGSRMHSAVQKQYLLLRGKPVLCYSLELFQRSSSIDDVILVTGKDELDYCREHIVRQYGYHKVKAIVPGGAERYLSVYEGLKAAEGCGTVLIHDGARPFADEAMLGRLLDEVRRSGACVAAVPAKDTIKIADEEGFATDTPKRSSLWIIQTPQVFSYELIRDAYAGFIGEGRTGATDDAMIIETMTPHRVKLVMGSYRNLKITTPEDLPMAEAIAEK